MGDLVLDLTLELMIKKTVHNHFHLQARTSNFTFEEKMILISIIQKYKEVIENKATGSMMWKKRKLHGRPLQRNLMPAQLRHDQENRASLTATGRGPGTPWMGDLVLDLTLELMIKKSVHGLNNPTAQYLLNDLTSRLYLCIYISSLL
nr:unnamed protein product [Callosobruchus chinensis]